jgi:hypothetical protein
MEMDALVSDATPEAVSVVAATAPVTVPVTLPVMLPSKPLSM